MRRIRGYKAVSQSQWQVQRERLAVPDAFPPPEWREARLLGEALPDLMKRLGLGEQHWLTELQQSWADVVGRGVASHTKPGRLEGRTLSVFVDSPVWMNELSRYGRPQMLANLQKRFGEARIAAVKLEPDPGD